MGCLSNMETPQGLGSCHILMHLSSRISLWSWRTKPVVLWLVQAEHRSDGGWEDQPGSYYSAPMLFRLPSLEVIGGQPESPFSSRDCRSTGCSGYLPPPSSWRVLPSRSSRGRGNGAGRVGTEIWKASLLGCQGFSQRTLFPSQKCSEKLNTAFRWLRKVLWQRPEVASGAGNAQPCRQSLYLKG